MQLLTSILAGLDELSKPRKRFLIQYFSTLFVVRGRFNFTNVARYGDFSERTLRRNFRKKWDWVRLNFAILSRIDLGETIAAIDASAIEKSGKKTFGLGWFWSGSQNRAIKGLEISCVALVSLRLRTAFSISVRQTDGAVKEISRLDKYLLQVRSCISQLRKHVKYLVADGFYSKKSFIDGVTAARLHFIGRLRDDANMSYLFSGEPSKGKGRRRKYATKFRGIDRRSFRFVCELESPDEGLYSCNLWHHSLKRIIRVAAIYNLNTKKYTLLFSTDTELPAEKILEYYRARYQIEFLFRDAKQHTGLTDCQSRNRRSLNFHFNAALTAINIAKADLNKAGKLQIDIPISIADYKRTHENQAMMYRFIRMLDLNPDFIFNHPRYEELINWGRLAA